MVRTINGLWSTFMEHVRDRVRSPIVFSFVISWIVINWKLVLVFLFMQGGILHRIEKIESFDEFGDYYRNFWIPLSMSLIYTIVIPFLNVYILKLLKNTHEQEIEIQFNKKSLLLNREMEFERNKKSLQEQINSNLNIDNLKQEMVNKEHEISRLLGDIAGKNNEIEKLLIDLGNSERQFKVQQERMQEEFYRELQRERDNHQGEIDKLIRERTMLETNFQNDIQREREGFHRERDSLDFRWQQELQRKEEEFHTQVQRERHNYEHEIDILKRKIGELETSKK